MSKSKVQAFIQACRVCHGGSAAARNQAVPMLGSLLRPRPLAELPSVCGVFTKLIWSVTIEVEVQPRDPNLQRSTRYTTTGRRHDISWELRDLQDPACSKRVTSMVLPAALHATTPLPCELVQRLFDLWISHIFQRLIEPQCHELLRQHRVEVPEVPTLASLTP